MTKNSTKTSQQVESLALIKPTEDAKQVWAMTPEQSADLKALHDSIQLTQDTDTETTEETRLTVGSEAWHERRRESHKLVERKRREAINQGINEIASRVPGCEKNKGSILHRAVEYIQQLKDQEAVMIEKASVERLSADQEIKEIQQLVKVYKEQAERLTREIEKRKEDLENTQVENMHLKKRLKIQEES
ncbi:hypothetical protein G6F56_003115 [Rhizopus delemar]|nr:hypothetical protein G6F56_003115 [Rhizopus delemar]